MNRLRLLALAVTFCAASASAEAPVAETRAAALAPARLATIRPFVAAADNDGDGLLRLEELLTGLGVARSCLPRRLDAGRALAEMPARVRERYAADFASADRDGDGRLSVTEFALASYEPAAAMRGR